MKKLISLVLVLVLAFSSMNVIAFADNETLYRDGEFEFVVRNDLAYITKVKSNGTSDVHFTARVCCDNDRIIGNYSANSFVDDDNEAPDYFGTDYVFVAGLIDGAFDEISNEVKTIYIPRYLTDFDVSIFNGLSNLESISVNEINADLSSSNGSLYNAAKTKFLYHPQASTDNSILSTVTEIEPKAFSYSSKITSVSIPSGVTVIPERCFESCTALKSIDFSSSNVSQIERFAFLDSGLTSLTLPSTIKSVKTYAFNNCSELNEVTIPDSVTDLSLSPYSFINCKFDKITLPRGVSSIANTSFGYYFDDEYNIQKKDSFVVTGYKYNSDKTAQTPAYIFASENSFEFIPLDDIYTVKYVFNNLKGYDSTMYLYDKKDLAYSVTSSNGVFEINGVAAGKYNIYFRSKFGTLIKGGSVSIVVSSEKELYSLSTKNKSPLGDVNNDGVINMTDMALLLKVENYSSSNADFDIDLDGSVGMSDISVILNSYNYGRTDVEISSVIDTPIIPING